MSKMKQLVLIMLLSTLAVGCEKEGPMESAGKAADQAVKDAGETIEDSRKKMEDAIEERNKKN